MRTIPYQRKWFGNSIRSWNNEDDPEFAEILTRKGFGFTFNMIEDFRLLNLKNVSNDFRYFYRDKEPKARPLSTGNQLGNKLSVKFPERLFGSWFGVYCRYASFAVHSPFEFPIAQNMHLFEEEKDLTVWITPEITQTDDDLRSFSPDHRKCFFDDERKLKYFKKYTQRNCEMECLSFIGEFLLILMLDCFLFGNHFSLPKLQLRSILCHSQ